MLDFLRRIGINITGILSAVFFSLKTGGLVWFTYSLISSFATLFINVYLYRVFGFDKSVLYALNFVLPVLSGLPFAYFVFRMMKKYYIPSTVETIIWITAGLVIGFGIAALSVYALGLV